MDALNSHSGIHADGEILANYSSSEPQLRRMLKFYSDHNSEKFVTCGFKTKLRDIQDKIEFRNLLVNENIRVIYLERRNVIKTVVSKFNAYRLNNIKGLWNITDKKERIGKESIDINEFDKWLSGTLEYKQELEQFVAQIERPVLYLYYEDLMLDESKVFKKIFSFLGVEWEDIKGRFIKYTDDDLKKSVVNFEELKMHYRGTVFENMFDEVLIKNG